MLIIWHASKEDEAVNTKTPQNVPNVLLVIHVVLEIDELEPLLD
jgi:hypothetical protein